MIRLNAFFELKEGVDEEAFLALCKELVRKSLTDNGNVAYDFFRSATRPEVWVICETWQDAEALAEHKAAPHFIKLVPQIKALTKCGMKSEQFVF